MTPACFTNILPTLLEKLRIYCPCYEYIVQKHRRRTSGEVFRREVPIHQLVEEGGDYRNRRPDFVATFLDKLVNWDFAAKNFA